MFLIKKLAVYWLAPLPLLLAIALICLLLIALGRWRKTALCLATLSLTTLWLISTAGISDALIRPYEAHIATYQPGEIEPEYIVILGCGHLNNPSRPPSSELAECAVKRVSEGIRIALMHPDAQVLFTGYGGVQPLSTAETNASFALSLGLDASRVQIFPEPRDTYAEAQAVAPVIGDAPFVLVSSASHLPRAIRLFNNAGLAPMPAPTHHLDAGDTPHSWYAYVPQARELRKAERALYEWLGNLWVSLTGDKVR